MSVPLGNEIPPTQLHAPASLMPDVPDVYTRFSALVTLAEKRFGGQLGGKLLLYGKIDTDGSAAALAANIAGAATLGVDADLERLRQVIRHGFCDFVVNNLDEALRILKNEVRKKQPVSVCLEGDLAVMLRETVERGLQPDLLTLPEKTDAVRTLIERGAIAVDAELSPNTSLTAITWSAESAPALWLPKVDALAARVLPDSDPRSRWLRFAPRYLGRAMAGQHYVQMSAGEADQFSILATEAMASGAIGTKITIQRPE